MEEKLKKIYLDASVAGSLSGLQNFYRALKLRGIKISLKKVKEWLMSQQVYTLHRPARKHYLRNKVISYGIDYIWQIDLVDMAKFSKLNNDFKFLITCIDVFSKFAWVVPIKNKTADAVLNGFKKILQGGRRPLKIQTDKGKEFLNSSFKNFLVKEDIHLYSLDSELKACVVERFNRTLKEKMFRYFTYKNNYKYVEVLDHLVKSYNNSYHRTIKMTPSSVTKENEKLLRETVFIVKNVPVTKIALQVGDVVRISKFKNIFAKGYTPNWTEEIFIVDKVIHRTPVVFKLRDLNGENIEGIFYKEELQKINKIDDVYKIDTILKKRKRKGITEYFVSWLGYPSSFNSWIQEKDIKK
jgi:hypothetical protein